MKARVKATGEIVEIESYDIDKLGKLKYFTKDFDVYDENEVEIILKRDPDYWTRLEHQAAISAMQGILGNQTYIRHLLETSTSAKEAREIIVDASYSLAHALVEKYKKEEK